MGTMNHQPEAGRAFFESISALGDRPFLFHNGRGYSYAELAGEIERIGGLLREGELGPGEVVALTGDYNFAAAAGFLALARNRNVVVPLVGGDVREVAERKGNANWELRIPNEQGTGEGIANVELRIANGSELGGDGNEGPGTAGGLALLRAFREKNRAGLVLFSSGSTGKAKGMLHDLDTLMASYAPGKAKGLRVLAFMGLDHIGGIDIFLRGIASGSCLVIPGERSPEAICRLIEEAEVDVLPATPSFLNLMLLSDARGGRDLSSLKIIGFGAERMPEAVLRRLREVFPNVRFQQKFGTSETNAVRTVSKEEDPLWMRIDEAGVESKIVDGELWLKTPSRIIGYLNGGSDRLTADGWYRTGDLAEEDGHGFFRVVGRRESMINVGGEKVVPGDVEAAIGEVPGVADCRVFGVENPLMGQVVGAEIVAPGKGDEKEIVRAVRKHCRQKLAPFKVPVRIEVVDSIAVTERFKRKI